ncbi:TPA: primosomal protein N', partial [Streptococcus pneumoniae]|nr:primosomal protein N' [Streptococcus pneumoniae]
MALAKIIVDVPLMQTDQPYSYRIPEEFEGMLEVGMRVHVPFGKGNRLIQGIVLGLKSQSDGEEMEQDLKDIAEVLDFSPVLTPEQLWLAEELRKSVFSYKISILKAMLPGFLNSSYDKILYPLEGLSQEERVRLFGSEDSLAFSSLDLAKQAEMMRLTRKGLLGLEYQAVDQKKVKTQSWYEVDHAQLEGVEISTRAKKKLELRDYLLSHPESASLASLLESYSREQVNFFVDQGAVTIVQKEVQRSAAYFEGIEASRPLELNPEQRQARDAVVSSIGSSQPPFLLQGITGSGKTEVYLQIIQGALDKGKTAILLVPEISLTPQMTERFIARFGDKVAILHSGLSNGEKYDEWRKVERGDAQVVVGARSAIFAPLKNLGVMIIDEEHEAAYKQDS